MMMILPLPAGFAGLNQGSSRRRHLLLFDRLWLRGSLLALFVAFARESLVSRLQMSACVASHVALHAERAVASLKGALERTLACVAVNVDLETARASEPFPAVLALILGRLLFWGHQSRRNDRAGARIGWGDWPSILVARLWCSRRTRGEVLVRRRRGRGI